MSTDDTATTELRRRRYHFGPRTILLFTVLLAVALGLIFYYRFHLLWWLSAERAQLGDVQAVLTGPMPETPAPDDWVRCRFGSLEFKLPPEMAKNIEAPKTGASVLVFRDGARVIIADLPTCETADDVLEILPRHARAKGVSLPRLRLACYRASSDDFRWSMTPEEVSWHAWCIGAGVFLRLGKDGHVETLMRDDLEAIIHFQEGLTQFNWQNTKNGAWSSMSFRDLSGRLDPTWVRAVCESLRFSGETYPDSMPKEKLLGLFEILSE